MTRITCLLLVFCTAGCGGSDGDSENEALCDALRDKIGECQLNVDTSMGCAENPSDAVVCAAQCVVDAECAQITGAVQDNPYYRCVAVCSGASEDDFICADGSGFLPQAGVCDGTPQCPDGSDEASCG